jgi:WD40 repeat protein
VRLAENMSSPKSKRRRSGASACSSACRRCAAMSVEDTVTSTALVGACTGVQMEDGCTACGVSGHSHVTCVLLGAALHRWMLQLGPGQDMTLVVDIILRLLMWGWREARCGEPIMCLSYTPGGDIISAGGQDGSVFFMSAQTGEKIDVTRGKWPHTVGGLGGVNSMAFSSDGATIAAAYLSEIQVFGPYTCRVDAQTQEKTLRGHEKDIEECKCFPIDWSKPFPRPECPVSGHSASVSCLAFKPGDPDILVSGSWDKTLKIWDLSTPACLSTVNVDSTVKSVAFSPDGDMIAAGCHNGTINLMDALTGQVKRSVNVDSRAWSVAFSPCGKTMAVGCDDGTVAIVDVATVAVMRSLIVDVTEVLSIVYSPSGDTVAVGCASGKVLIVDAVTIAVMRSVRGHCKESPECICFEEEEEVSDEEPFPRPDCPVTGHSGLVSSVAFSADGRWVMSGSSDKTIRLWDTHAVAQ